MDNDQRPHPRDKIRHQAAGSLSRRTMLSTAEEPQGGIRLKERGHDVVQPERVRETNQTTGRRGSEERRLVFRGSERGAEWLSDVARSAQFHAPGLERPHAFAH